MRFVRKKTKIVLCLALALCLVSMVGVSLMQCNFGKTKVSVFTGSLSEVANMIRENNKAYGKDASDIF